MFLDIENYRIFPYVDDQYDGLPCYLIDFRRHLKPLISLQKTVVKHQSTMRPVSATYSYNGEVLVRLRWTFTVDAANLMTHRKQEICYVLNDGTDGGWFVKEDQAFSLADTEQRIEIIKEREVSRAALVDDIKMVIMGVLQQLRPTENAIVLGSALVHIYSSDIDAFIQTGGAQFKDAITNDTTMIWLDDEMAPGFTIRDYVLSRLG